MSGYVATEALGHSATASAAVATEGLDVLCRGRPQYEPASAIEDAALAVADVLSETSCDMEWVNVLSVILLDLSNNSPELHDILCRHGWDRVGEVDEGFMHIPDCDDLLSDLHYALLGDHVTLLNAPVNPTGPSELESIGSDNHLLPIVDCGNGGLIERQHSSFDSQHPVADPQTSTVLRSKALHPLPSMPTMKPPWAAVADRASGKIYYWNRDDNETTWDPPHGFIIKPDDTCNPGQHLQQHLPIQVGTIPIRADLSEVRSAWDGRLYTFPQFFAEYGPNAQDFWSRCNDNEESPNCLQAALNFSGPNRVSHRPLSDGSSLSDAAAALGITPHECKKVAFFKLRDLHPRASYAILGTVGKGQFHAVSDLHDKPASFEYHAFVLHVGLTLWFAPSNSGPCGVKLHTLYKMSRDDCELIDASAAAAVDEAPVGTSVTIARTDIGQMMSDQVHMVPSTMR